MTASVIDIATVRAAFMRLFIAVDGVTLRREDEQKVLEATGLLSLLGRLRTDAILVDAAGGKGSVGLLAAEIVGVRRVIIIERNPAHASLARAAVTRLSVQAEIAVHEADVHDDTAWVAAADVVVALHACGPASDAVLDMAVKHRAKRLFLVPCCYADAVPFATRARALADRIGVPTHAEVRRRAVTSLIDAERTLRLEAAGYETVVSSFVSPTVTPHNLVWRARMVGEATRMREAAQSLTRLRDG